MATTIYEIALRAPTEEDPAGRVVEMKEMGTEQLLQAYRLSGAQYTGEAANWDVKLMALRLCLIRDGDEPLTYEGLQRSLWDDRFSLKESMLLVMMWARVHEPSQEDVDGLGGVLRAKSGA